MSSLIPYFSAEEIAAKVPMKKAISLMAETYRQISTKEAHVPIREHFFMPQESAQALFMPAYLAGDRTFGLKVVGIHDDNPAKDLPYIHAVVLLMDASTGRPLLLADGTFITSLRTGAGSGIATDLLARKDARILAVFGAGVQARTQIEAVLAVRNIEQIFIFNRSKEKALDLIKEIKEQYAIPASLGNEKELNSADIICTATSTSFPLFSHQNLKKGVHINAIGAYRKDMAEVPAETVIASRIFVDQLEASWKEAGDLVQPLEKNLIRKDHIMGEIGQIVLGQIVGRTSASEITLFKSVGNAAQDLAIAGALMRE
ncbi:MAG: hypothetical protein AAF696_11475 [Bacteroidota bacterium]